MNIYCGISFHGFGHLAQTASILNSLYQRIPNLNFTIQCEAEKSLLDTWFSFPFAHIPEQTDLGIPMINAVKADIESTYQQYRSQQENHAALVTQLQKNIVKQQADVVLTNNCPQLSRAANNLNIPSFHFCSLNWADIFFHYCREKPKANEIYQQLCDDYNCADAFFRISPGMEMPSFNHLIKVGPVCRTGHKRDLRKAFGHTENKQYVLVTMGGLPFTLDLNQWPSTKGIFWVIAGDLQVNREDMIHFRDTSVRHIDLVFSCDALITKPGYGTFSEAACAQTPVLYLPRQDWPEEPYLVSWLSEHNYCQPIKTADLLSGNLQDLVESVTELKERDAAEGKYKAPVQPTGIEEIISHISPLLSR